MIGQKQVSKNRVAAFSIVESMVAMALIVIAFSFGMQFYLQLSTQDRIVTLTKAKQLAEYELESSIQQRNFTDQVKYFGALQIEKVLLETNRASIEMLQVIAILEKDTLYDVRELVKP